MTRVEHRDSPEWEFRTRTDIMPIHRKLQRLATRQPARVLDLFAGCGGLSLGFQAAGFRIAAAIENDQDAARSHGENFHPGDPRHSRPRDVTTPPTQLTASLGLENAQDAFDIVIGSPPCQAFARIGRAKLREVDNHPKAFLHDGRWTLFHQWLEHVRVCEPLAAVMENVPDVLNHGGRNIAEETCQALERYGYRCAYTLLNAAFYGVPQFRERMFLIAYRRELAQPISFPEPTCYAELPKGYRSSKNVALKGLTNGNTTSKTTHYVEPPERRFGSPAAVTAREAIGDLPPIFALAELEAGKLRKGARRENVPLDCTTADTPSHYATRMRQWPGFHGSRTLCDHVIRYIPRDYRLFARMKCGDQYPQAHRVALELFETELAEWRAQGLTVTPESESYRRLKRLFVPPYDAGKFPNRWRKIWPDQPARTLMAHLGKDSYNHIHYDHGQARTISVREAARLQSFPDGFRFSGGMNAAFRQIGNAVPPLLAMALAQELFHRMHPTNDVAGPG